MKATATESTEGAGEEGAAVHQTDGQTDRQTNRQTDRDRERESTVHHVICPSLILTSLN